MASGLTSKRMEPGTETNMDTDYVIVYRFADTGKSEATRTFRNLVGRLASLGLTTEVRNGDNHSVLIFAKMASDKHLYGEIYRSRTKDWLYGVRTAAPDKIKQSIDQERLYPAERLRIIYQLITSPVEEGGAGITPKKGEWVNVESIFALHDYEFNRKWIAKWATSYILKPEDLDEIRDKFGEKVAFYFGFVQAYFTALIGMAAFGISAWAILGNFSAIYGIINCLLCVGFVEYWKYQETELAMRWGVKGVSAMETKRHDFASEKEIKDPVTGETTQYFPQPKRLQRQLLQVPFALVAALALGSLLAISFSIEIFMSEIYSGPGQSILVFLPTGIITTMQPVVLGLLTDIATKLTKYENYETSEKYERSLTQKIFVLNFITSYMPIILTAFVYVPFAEVLVPYLDVFQLAVRPFVEDEKQMAVPSTGFRINPDRLKKQVIYFTVTAQIVNQVLEVVLPFVKRRGFSKYKEYQSKQAAKRGGNISAEASAHDAPEEKAFLNRVRKEAELGEYDVTTDFREMVVQYGYLALFSIVWPPTSASFLVNNWFEMRTDAVKICIESQRPTPWRADGIGPWLDSLEFLTWVGSISTAAIAYLFSNGGLGPDGTPRNIQAWALLLVIFFSEHCYLAVRLAVRTFISKLDSPGRQKERAERFLVRKKYLEESMGEQAQRLAPGRADEEISRGSLEQDARRGTMGTEMVEQRFWRRQRGWEESVEFGVGLIERAAAVESKKGQ